MRYDYQCHRCGWNGEREVRLAERDTQTCHKCGKWMERLPHYATVAVTIPLYMRAENTMNENHILPPKKEDREAFLARAHASGYRRRTDLA